MQVWIYNFVESSVVVHRNDDNSGGAYECERHSEVEDRLTELQNAARDAKESFELVEVSDSPAG